MFVCVHLFVSVSTHIHEDKVLKLTKINDKKSHKSS